ncbi:MAG: hypothetical protein ACP5KW_10825 [Thermoproteota archaeon]
MLVVAQPLPWIKNNAKLEYKGTVKFIDFYYGSMIPKNLLKYSEFPLNESQIQNEFMASLLLNETMPFSLSVVVLRVMNETAGILNVSLKIGPYLFSKKLLVNFKTRNVYFLNGTLLGKTIIWILPCKVGDAIALVGNGNSTVFAEVSSSPIPIRLGKDSLFSLINPINLQDTISLSVGTSPKYKGLSASERIGPIERQSVEHFEYRVNYYDSDAFVLVRGSISGDALLSAFGIMSYLGDEVSLVYTNIDLGPPSFSILISLLSVPVAIIVLTLGIVYLLIKKRR